MSSRWDDDTATLAAHPVQVIDEERLTHAEDAVNFQHDAAKDAIRAFCEDPVRILAFIGASADPYRETASITIYADDHGYEYWYDPDDGVLVQAGPRASDGPTARKTLPDDRRSIPELREHALRIAERAVPGFDQRRQYLHPLEANRDAYVYFFRWDDFGSPLTESELPPFLQVGLYADGTLASFTDTLRRS